MRVASRGETLSRPEPPHSYQVRHSFVAPARQELTTPVIAPSYSEIHPNIPNEKRSEHAPEGDAHQES
jgi:hypothetical protein